MDKHMNTDEQIFGRAMRVGVTVFGSSEISAFISVHPRFQLLF